MKEKSHKPWSKKDVGKTFVFFRHADKSELPEPEVKDATISIGMMCSGTTTFIMPPIKKDRGVLVKIEATITHEQYNVGCDCYDDCDCKAIYEIKTRRFYEYQFAVKGYSRSTNSRTMENGINGRFLLEEPKKPAKKTGKKK